MLVNGFKAEYGQASGGVVNVITRSGTNQFRGSGFCLFQDEDLRSRSPYANRALPKDPSQRIQYGATIGGPIRQNRTHFFATYERDDRDTVSASTYTLPTAAAGRQRRAVDAEVPRRQQHRHRAVRRRRHAAAGAARVRRRPQGDRAASTSRSARNQYFTVRYLLDSNDQPSGQSGTLLDYNGGRTYLKTQYVNFNHKWVLGANKLNEAYVQYGNHHEEIDAIYNTIPRVGVSGGFRPRIDHQLQPGQQPRRRVQQQPDLDAWPARAPASTC